MKLTRNVEAYPPIFTPYTVHITVDTKEDETLIQDVIKKGLELPISVGGFSSKIATERKYLLNAIQPYFNS